MNINLSEAVTHKRKLLELLRTECIEARGNVVLGDNGLEIRIKLINEQDLRRAHAILPLELEGFHVALS